MQDGLPLGLHRRRNGLRRGVGCITVGDVGDVPRVGGDGRLRGLAQLPWVYVRQRLDHFPARKRLLLGVKEGERELVPRMTPAATLPRGRRPSSWRPFSPVLLRLNSHDDLVRRLTPRRRGHLRYLLLALLILSEVDAEDGRGYRSVIGHQPRLRPVSSCRTSSSLTGVALRCRVMRLLHVGQVSRGHLRLLLPRLGRCIVPTPPNARAVAPLQSGGARFVRSRRWTFQSVRSFIGRRLLVQFRTGLELVRTASIAT